MRRSIAVLLCILLVLSLLPIQILHLTTIALLQSKEFLKALIIALKQFIQTRKRILKIIPSRMDNFR